MSSQLFLKTEFPLLDAPLPRCVPEAMSALGQLDRQKGNRVIDDPPRCAAPAVTVCFKAAHSQRTHTAPGSAAQ